MTKPDTVTSLNDALDGRYTITGTLGEGGMAVVYLAEDLRHHRKVAIKGSSPSWPRW